MTLQNNCPQCGSVLITATFGKKINEGDLSVCDKCATMLYLNSANKLLILTISEFNKLEPETQRELNELVYNIVNKHK